jgi:hypothetical protein
VDALSGARYLLMPISQGRTSIITLVAGVEVGTAELELSSRAELAVVIDVLEHSGLLERLLPRSQAGPGR